MKKEKLNIEQQINHMQDKGIKFQAINKEKAKEILSYETYYFKLKSYAKIYQKTSNKYENLEFSYIYEISKIDMFFRNFIMKISLNTEHLLKTSFLYKFSNTNNDGYNIVKQFLESEDGNNTNDRIQEYKNAIDKNKAGGIYDLIRHYLNEMPVWVFIEILSFNDFIKFYTFCTKIDSKLEITKEPIRWALESTKWLRNLSAHNNSVLMRIDNSTRETRRHLLNKLSPFRKSIISKTDSYTLEEMLNKSLVNDFLEAVNLFSQVCKSSDMKICIIEEFNNFIKYTESKKDVIDTNQKLSDFMNFIGKSFKILLK